MLQSAGMWIELSPEMPQSGMPGATADGVTPFPVNEIVAGELLALLATEMLPLALPVAGGVKVTLSVADWPGVSVVLALTPLAPYAAPLAVTPEIVTLELPVFLRVSPRELLPPTFTFPKFTLVGNAVNCGVAAAPEPDKSIVVGELLASLVTVRLPVALPEEDGAKRICSVTLWPAAMEDMGVPFVMENAKPVMLVLETVTEEVPLFFSVTLWVGALPTETFPKLRLAGVAERVFDPVDCVFAVM